MKYLRTVITHKISGVVNWKRLLSDASPAVITGGTATLHRGADALARAARRAGRKNRRREVHLDGKNGPRNEVDMYGGRNYSANSAIMCYAWGYIGEQDRTSECQ